MNEIQNERFAHPIFSRELERRWSLVRNGMKEHGIDCLIMQNDNQFLSGYIRYFLDLPANGYRTTVLFPANEEMIVINHGGVNDPPFPPDWASRGVEDGIPSPYMQVLHYTNTNAAEITVKRIKERGYKKIGFVLV